MTALAEDPASVTKPTAPPEHPSAVAIASATPSRLPMFMKESPVILNATSNRVLGLVPD
jgi:hypothetical protein